MPPPPWCGQVYTSGHMCWVNFPLPSAAGMRERRAMKSFVLIRCAYQLQGDSQPELDLHSRAEDNREMVCGTLWLWMHPAVPVHPRGQRVITQSRQGCLTHGCSRRYQGQGFHSSYSGIEGLIPSAGRTLDCTAAPHCYSTSLRHPTADELKHIVPLC